MNATTIKLAALIKRVSAGEAISSGELQSLLESVQALEYHNERLVAFALKAVPVDIAVESIAEARTTGESKLKKELLGRAVMWLALNNEPGDEWALDAEALSEQIPILLVAETFDVQAITVAEAIVAFRKGTGGGK